MLRSSGIMPEKRLGRLNHGAEISYVRRVGVCLVYILLPMTKVWNHEGAERLYCEEIDVGEGAPRSIASGLREHLTLEEMQGRLVLVVCNLRPAKLAGFFSNGMVLAAKGANGQAGFVGVGRGGGVRGWCSVGGGRGGAGGAGLGLGAVGGLRNEKNQVLFFLFFSF